MDYTQLRQLKTHPDPSKDPIEILLEDADWAINETMAPQTDEVFNDIPNWTVTRYRCSRIKRAPKVTYKAFTTDALFGKFQLTGMPNKVTNTTVDVFGYSDSRMKNGLKDVVDSDHFPVDIDRKQGYTIRKWVYQEELVPMGWALLTADAFWDRGPLFKFGCGVYHSTWPLPNPLYTYGEEIDFVGTVLPNGFLQQGYWNVYYNFEHSRYGIDIPGGGSAIIHKVFEGPGFRFPNPELWGIYEITETVPLVGVSPLFPDRAYNSGNIEWRTRWIAVPPEVAPFIIWTCPYS